MSAITVGGDLVHYEVLGRGRPVILVHGWLGSWRYWVPTMQQLHLKYRVYAIDLFGFGDSGKNPEKYTVAQQVRLIDEFMKQLGIPKAAMIGHGLGALVLTEFAVENQDKVARLLISSAPIFDPGDLENRLRPGQRRLLTVEGNPANELAEAKTESAPTPVTPLTNNRDKTVVNRSDAPTAPSASAASTPAASAASTPVESTPVAAPVAATAPTATATTTPASATPTPVSSTAPAANASTASASSPAATPTPAAPAGEATIARKPDSPPLAAISSHDVPTVPRVGSEARARLDEAAAARTASTTASTTTVASAPPTPAESAAQKIDLLAAMMLSNQNPLMESMAAANLSGLLAKCFKASEPSYEKLKVDVDKTDDNVLKHSVKNFDSGKMLDALRLLSMPLVVVHGTDDPIIPPPNENVWQYLTADKEDLLLPIPLPGVRHFPMLEHEPFIRLASQFLEIPEISKLEVKERWVRRTR
jgi:pimeloyl-ACP methyl ester carboxylesterase